MSLSQDIAERLRALDGFDADPGDLSGEILAAAAWRLGKAEEHPEEPRHRIAAHDLTCLAEDLLALGGRHPLVMAYYALFDADTYAGNGGISAFAIQREALRSIGFSTAYVSAEAFLTNLMPLISRPATARAA